MITTRSLENAVILCKKKEKRDTVLATFPITDACLPYLHIVCTFNMIRQKINFKANYKPIKKKSIIRRFQLNSKNKNP